MSRGYFESNIEEVKELRQSLVNKQKKGHCIVCTKRLPKRKKWYCTDNCSIKIYKMAKYWYITWDMIRKEVFERDNFTCIKCGGKYGSRSLECHHIIPYSVEEDLHVIRWNLTTLCLECHKEITKEMYRSKYLHNIIDINYNFVFFFLTVFKFRRKLIQNNLVSYLEKTVKVS